MSDALHVPPEILAAAREQVRELFGVNPNIPGHQGEIITTAFGAGMHYAYNERSEKSLYPPLPPEMIAECRRLARIHYGSDRGDLRLLAEVFARGMQHARNLDKDAIEAYEAERAEWEAERAEEPEFMLNLNLNISDEALADIRDRFVAAVQRGNGAEFLPAVPEYTPIKDIKEAARQEVRYQVLSVHHVIGGGKIFKNKYCAQDHEVWPCRTARVIGVTE